MDLVVAVALLLALVSSSLQHECDTCDCTISGAEDRKAVLVKQITCQEGQVTWYNPTSSLRLDIKPTTINKPFTACFVVDSGNVKLKISQEVDPMSRTNTRSPEARSRFIMNDHNLAPVVTTDGKSQEICLSADERLILYLEPEIANFLGYQKILIMYDIAEKKIQNAESSLNECRPCSEDEVLTAYCSSDFVIVGKMDDVNHVEDKTHVTVAVNQIIRQAGSHFSRTHRDSPYLQGTIVAHRKCGVVKGEGLFLMTGRKRLGELRMGCAPTLDDWESMATKAELEGRMMCSRD